MEQEKITDPAVNDFIPEETRPDPKKKTDIDVSEKDLPKKEIDPEPWEDAFLKDDRPVNIEGSDLQIWKEGEVFIFRKRGSDDGLEIQITKEELRGLGKFFTGAQG